MKPVVELEDVHKQYLIGGSTVDVLRGVSWRLGRGEAVAVMGPSGSGKTTLLALMGGLDAPTSGAVRLDGRDLATLGDRALAALRNRAIGFVFQWHHLLPQCSALENVLVPTLVADPETRRAGPERARRLLARVGLEARLHHRPGQLSGGECQRVALVRALINGPSLILADEPTGSLDRASADAMAALLAQLHREEGVTLVVATHSPALARRMGRVLELRDGVLVEPDGPLF